MRKRKVSNVLLTGAAKEGILGPPEKPVQVYYLRGGCYYVRVTLPGRQTDLCDVKHGFLANGQVIVRGMLTCGQILGPSTMPIVHNNKRRRLSPFGPFSISFKLPGHVDPRLSLRRLHPDGTYEIVFATNNK